MAGGTPGEYHRPPTSRKTPLINVIGFGDNIIDRFIDRRMLYPGGNALNFSVFARRLGAVSDYMGVFGSDQLADFMRESLIREGVGITHSVTRTGFSGWAEVHLDAGERVFGDWNGGGITTSAPMVLDTSALARIASARLVHSGAYSQIEAELPKLAPLPTLVSFDLSSGASNRTPQYLSVVCPFVDLALVSCAELSDDGVKRLLAEIVDHGAGMALGTRGTRGSVLFDGTSYHTGVSEPVAVDAVKDTMGCGDAYLTAFALDLLSSGWEKGSSPTADDIAQALKAGAVFAARQCLTEGSFGHGRPFQVAAEDTGQTRSAVG